MKPKYKMIIRYKSGQEQVVWCDEFEITKSAGGVKASWENMKPRPLVLGVDDIESVWAVE